MTKICPNCKTENSDNAGFCQECGTALKEPDISKNDEKSGNKITNLWNKQNKRRKASIGILGIVFVGLIILVIIFGGMFAPLDNTPVALAPAANFTDNSIAFNYPNDMVNDSLITNASGNGVVYEPSLGNENVIITIINYPKFKNYNASEVRDSFVENNNGITDQVISTTDETNSNGIQVSRYIEKYRTDDGTVLIDYVLLFQDNNGLNYKITVFGDVSKNSLINETATEVFNTLTTSTQTSNNNITQNTQSNQNNSMISASQAKAIANEYESKYNLEAFGNVEYIDTIAEGLYANPFYHVDLKYKNDSSDNPSEAAYVTIDAKTGAIIS